MHIKASRYELFHRARSFGMKPLPISHRPPSFSSSWGRPLPLSFTAAELIRRIIVDEENIDGIPQFMWYYIYTGFIEDVFFSRSPLFFRRPKISGYCFPFDTSSAHRSFPSFGTPVLWLHLDHFCFRFFFKENLLSKWTEWIPFESMKKKIENRKQWCSHRRGYRRLCSSRTQIVH